MCRVLVLLSLLTAALSAQAAEWRFGHCQIQWLDGWTRVEDIDLIRLIAPSPIHAAVTIDIVDQESPRGKWISYAKETLPELASHHGKVVEALREEPLRFGATLFSIACYDADRNYYGIIFAHVSAEGRVVQLAVEGVGNPKQVFSKFNDMARTVYWANEPNHSPDPTPALGVLPARQETRHG